MAENSKIEWCHHTFNPWRGCTKVSDGCKFCYAEKWGERNPSVLGVWGPKGTRVVASESTWREPVKWGNAAAAAKDSRARVLCASLADVFEGQDTMPADAWEPVQAARRRLFGVIQNAPNLDWLLLTKRPQNIMPIMRAMPLWDDYPDGQNMEHYISLPNVWTGTSVENPSVLDRVRALQQIPATVRFLSIEPLLGPIDDLPLEGVHWVIVGGESGPNARPMRAEWARSIRDQCAAAGVPFLFKQWGQTLPGSQAESYNSEWRNKEYSQNAVGWIVGKKEAGRLLDGRLHDGYPDPYPQGIS